MSQARRMVISALVPRRAPFLDVTVYVASSDVWFRPGEALYGKLMGFAFTSPCEVPLAEAAENGLSTEVLGVTYQPDGKLLIQGFISKEGTLKNGVKLSRLLPDGSVDPSFKGQDRCSSLTPSTPGRVWLQPDGRILLGSKSIFSSPNHEDKLALIITFEANHLSALADGGFIVARVGLLNAFEEQARVVLARLDSNGRIDRAAAERFRSAFAAEEISSIFCQTAAWTPAFIRRFRADPSAGTTSPRRIARSALRTAA
ncbi:hypothetical protein BO221_36435 [Archangium sp. Cb G35]|uniref:delta-60 repeat domain-containing protein n=1 Tax=Archangium sp. Cb G35 TaxID=1920190 RepID=UPI000936111F|nr:delta-60 repeat domain-containing protein [Archangium sp. Cb G35]OJT19011.1 hypothetical protein BO221_36435 [Archangium sp. Cb G35]